jgi:tryptophanyl-tRNA synthetase
MRPTGRLHIGHYFGALQNWVRLQNAVTPAGEKEYECFYFIADWHALTSDYADTSAVAENTLQIMMDYLAAGLDPAKSVIFQQSVIPEHAELHLLLSMVTPLGWLERVPTYKEALENVKDKDLHNYGFLGYPILQCADIVIYSKEGVPLFVPVGEDQVSHVEISREIVRKFNFHNGFWMDLAVLTNKNLSDSLRHIVELTGAGLGSPLYSYEELFSCVKAWAADIGHENFLKQIESANELKQYIGIKNILEEPQHLLTRTPRIPGLDGRKMSKSYGNAITLSETDEEIRAKTKVMVTDPARKRRMDPGNPDVCPVYDWHKLFAPKNDAGEYTAEGKATLQWAAEGCRSAGIGCIECKAKMADHLIEWIAPVRERRVDYEKHPGRVLEILDGGSKKARVVAQGTMERVREAVFGWGKKRKEVTSGECRVAR